ncbi:MAG TPA: hypothetical protein PLN52_01615 [Opitutaceae bacterium]|nr:hypothetical protein [Opitutaceae bacterium]
MSVSPLLLRDLTQLCQDHLTMRVEIVGVGAGLRDLQCTNETLFTP